MNNTIPAIAKTILTVNNLSVICDNNLVLDSVSLEIYPGTHNAIIGPNGAGKSTLIKAILGLIPYQSGQVSYFDEQGRRKKHLGSAIGYIPQKFPFEVTFPCTITELVGLSLNKGKWWQSSRKKRHIIQQALEQVNLKNQAEQKIGTLSGGQLKRLLLAYCLVIPRRLLILDEALAGVDIKGEAEFANLLSQLKQEQGWTILEVSHNLDIVKQYCDFVFCLNRQILDRGSPSEILTSENLQQIYGSVVNAYCHHHEH
ncbi:MAG: metal ABC transporter ATP-binding protein [Xenococcaceae cyanobacterium MO_188.B19]|nr:metal ABC transporter ATP-binding protein [Xenococcaceae cyanobacterium MO_188.B19]